MSMIRMAASAACCFVALFSGQAVAAGGAQCWQPYEVEAAKVRDLHVMLMLGTLKCQAAHPEIATKYDSFLQKKNGQLASYNNILKARFMRADGIADGQRAYEDFNTRLGNNHSGNAQPANVCEITDSLLTLAINAGSDELPMLARSFSESQLGLEDGCGQAAVPATAPVAVHEAVTATEVAKTESAAAVPPQSAAAALEAAAVALQTAAASLKAQPAAPDKPTEMPVAEPAVVPASATVTTPAG